MRATAEQKAYAARIFRAVARAAGLSPRDLLGRCKRHEISLARFCAWDVLRRRGATLAEIAAVADRRIGAVFYGLRSLQWGVASCEEARAKAHAWVAAGLKAAPGEFPHQPGARKRRPELAAFCADRREYLKMYQRIWRAERRAAANRNPGKHTI